MKSSREQVEQMARMLFPNSDANAILSLLDDYGAQDWQREKERVQLAILKLSTGDEEKLRYFTEVAKQDYRDVLMWADSPPSPEQAAAEFERAKTLLEKWGRK
jgi:hypothetical protein